MEPAAWSYESGMVTVKDKVFAVHAVKAVGKLEV